MSLELICEEDVDSQGRRVKRVTVPGGWLYQVEMRDENGSRWSEPVYVPDSTRARWK